MERVAAYRRNAGYCSRLLDRVAEGWGRKFIERERQDWLVLADQQRSWLDLRWRKPVDKAE